MEKEMVPKMSRSELRMGRRGSWTIDGLTSSRKEKKRSGVVSITTVTDVVARKSDRSRGANMAILCESSGGKIGA